MYRFIALTIALLLVSLTPAVADEAPYRMGYTAKRWVDSSRLAWGSESQARPVLTHIYYPTEAENVGPIYFGANNQAHFIAAEGLRDAPFASMGEKKHPLVIMSHGTGSGALQIAWLAKPLVEQGYIVAAINHHGNTFIEPYRAEGFSYFWERAADISFALDQMLANEHYAPYIDQDRIGALGFSIGGYTVVSALGGRTSLARFALEFCLSEKRDATCEPVREFPNREELLKEVVHLPASQQAIARERNDFRDSRIKAAVSISPVGQFFTPESLQNISTPLLLLVGDKDSITPGATNAGYIAEHVAGAQYQQVVGATHYSLISPCTESGVAEMGILCEPTFGRSRADIHRDFNAKVTAFFAENFDETPSVSTAQRSAGTH